MLLGEDATQMKNMLVISIGEILYDIFPGYKRIGGAPFNFAYHLQKMGIPVFFLSMIGKDQSGKDILDFLELNGFDTRLVQQSDRYRTGEVMVTLDHEGNPSFNIVKDAAYDHLRFNSHIAAVLQQEPNLIYFGTLAQRTEHGYDSIQRILSSRMPNTSSLYDVNLRPDCYNEKTIRASLRQSDLVKLNLEELQIIRNMLQLTGSEKDCVDHLMQHYGIEMISLTKGKAGSELFTSTGSYQLKNNSVEITGDTVGAGDAYTSILAVGYLNKWQPEQILEKATELAERICMIKGAIPQMTAFYDGILS